MQLDCKEPTMAYRDFLEGETRYTSLKKTFPEEAEKLFAQSEQDAQERFAKYAQMAQGK